MNHIQLLATGILSFLLPALGQEMMDDGMDGMMGMMWLWWLLGLAVLILIAVVIWRLVKSGTRKT